MHAEETKLLDLLKKSTQFTVPIFQRTYSWGEEEIRQLWDDIIRTGKNENINTHFVGSIVYILPREVDFVFQSGMVIDGQQRLTTITLLLEALAQSVGKEEPVDGFSADKIREYYLVNRLEKNERKYKLLLTQTDRDTLKNLVTQRKEPSEVSYRIKEAFAFFKNRIAELKGDLKALCSGLSKLWVVSISLSTGQDNPQLIFESMNSTGKELSQADLVRNYVLMDLPAEEQRRLYEEYWRPMEVGFGQEAYEMQFDAFMRHYLTLRTGKIPRIRDIYRAFKEYSVDPEKPFTNLEQLLGDLHRFSGYYASVALGRETDKKLCQAFQDLRDLNVDTSYPFVMELYDDYKHQILTKDDFLTVLRLTESYVFRRAVCNIPTNSLNKTFANFMKSINKDHYVESVRAIYQLMPSYRRFPTDEEFRREIKLRDLYNFRNKNYWLRKLENFNRKEPMRLEEYTIEHIMPQNEDLSLEWQRELGAEWKEIHESKLHTLGNLTLTGYNAEYSDRPFNEKKMMAGGFADSPLKLNEGLGQVPVWNKEAIEQRANRLADMAATVWTAPSLDEATLSPYREVSKQQSNYSLDDHPFLEEGRQTRILFDAIRKEILAIDPVVNEDILKFYIAYKAETNFVDIGPRKEALALILNIPFERLIDPRQAGRNVSELGRWGNGEVELKISTLAEIPYIMSLIRQSFEYQMGNGKEDS